MSNENMIQAKRLPNGKIVQVMPDGTIKPFESRTDWAAYDALTEEEITTAALSDPDSVILTDEQLAGLSHVLNPKEIRQRLHMTQEQFAEQFQVPLGTLRDWEQGVSVPD